MLKTITLATLLTSCATLTAEEHAKYDSLADWIQNRHWKSAPAPEEIPFFREIIPPLTVLAEGKVLTYIGDRQSNGYCLQVSYLHNDQEQTVCSLQEQGRVDGYVETVIENRARRSMSGLRTASPTGLNGHSWEQLDFLLEQLRYEFVQAAGERMDLREAARRVRRY